MLTNTSDNHRSAKPLLLGILATVVAGTLLWMGLVRTNTQRNAATSEISRILIQVRPDGGGLAMREFTADGWIHGGHSSPDSPERVYEEREQISRAETRTIWTAATTLGKDLHAIDITPQPQWDGYVELYILFDDQSAMRLSWPHKGYYPNHRVQALVKLLLQHDVGGW